MILSNPFDAPDAVRAREAQADPLVMYLVVRREQATALEPLLAAVAAAVVQADRAFRADPMFVPHVVAWHAGSFRKVTLRANEKDWLKLLASEPCVTGPAGDPFVAVLPPRPKSTAGRFLRSLQTYTIAPDELDTAPVAVADGPAVVIAANPAIAMSVGKLIAQVGHAALMCADAGPERGAGADWIAAVADWEASGCSVAVANPSEAGWNAALASLDAVVVTDSGLTEIEPGSRTVLATRPLSGADLGRALAILRG